MIKKISNLSLCVGLKLLIINGLLVTGDWLLVIGELVIGELLIGELVSCEVARAIIRKLMISISFF